MTIHFGNSGMTLCGEQSNVTIEFHLVNCPQCRAILVKNLTNLKEEENASRSDSSSDSTNSDTQI